jgi:hypothetical protein
MPAPSWVWVRKRESPNIIVTLKGTPRTNFVMSVSPWNRY